MDIPDHIIRLAKSEGFERVEPLGSWNGFDLFVADMDEECAIGLPQYILSSGDTARWASVDETDLIMSSVSD